MCRQINAKANLLYEMFSVVLCHYRLIWKSTDLLSWDYGRQRDPKWSFGATLGHWEDSFLESPYLNPFLLQLWDSPHVLGLILHFLSYVYQAQSHTWHPPGFVPLPNSMEVITGMALSLLKRYWATFLYNQKVCSLLVPALPCPPVVFPNTSRAFNILGLHILGTFVLPASGYEVHLWSRLILSYKQNLPDSVIFLSMLHKCWN